MIQLNLWPTLAFVVTMLSWFAFVITFLVHKKPPSPPDKKRDSSSIIGIVLQGVSYGIVWTIRRVWFTPMFGSNKYLEIVLAVLTMILAIGSVWFCSTAIRTLGEQWSLAARVVEGHKLVTEGPYSVVRNPIYTDCFLRSELLFVSAAKRNCYAKCSARSSMNTLMMFPRLFPI